MNVAFNNLNAQYQIVKNSLNEKLQECFEKGNFILGSPVEEFEKNFSVYTGTKHAVGVSNGTDAIKLGLLGLDLKGKTAVYMPANTYVATAFACKDAYPNCEIFLIDIDDTYQMDINILEFFLNKKSKKYKNNIIIPVHMFGNMCDMDSVLKLAKNYRCKILEDVSQAHGTKGKNFKLAGSYGDVSAFSLYPGKNLGAFGDAGIVVTNNKKIEERLRCLRHLGQKKKFVHEMLAFNNRLDTVQAIVLNEKLKFLDDWNQKRNFVAQNYLNKITNKKIILPKINSFCQFHSWHVFSILVDNVEKLQQYLKTNNIEYNSHYPIPVEKMKPFKYLKQNNKKTRYFCSHNLSLPIHPFMQAWEIDHVCNTLNKFN